MNRGRGVEIFSSLSDLSSQIMSAYINGPEVITHSHTNENFNNNKKSKQNNNNNNHGK